MFSVGPSTDVYLKASLLIKVRYILNENYSPTLGYTNMNLLLIKFSINVTLNKFNNFKNNLLKSI